MGHVTGSEHGILRSAPRSRLTEIMYHNKPVGKVPVLKVTHGDDSPDVFQKKVKSYARLRICTYLYLDDILVISNGSFEWHLHQLGKVLQMLCRAGLR